MYLDIKFLDLPKIPDELLASAKTPEIIKDCASIQYKRAYSVLTSATTVDYKVSKELEQWIQKNICEKYNQVSIRYTEGSATIPQTDIDNSYLLVYNISNGSGNIEFWQQWGHGVARDGKYVIDDYEKILRIDQYETPNYCWYIVNNKILNNVENMKFTRINVQVNLNYNPFE